MISTNTHTFFILGRERSGTTMLRVNLNNHPKIHIPPESPFIMYLYKKYVNKKKINLFEFINDLKQEPFLHIWNIDYENLLVILEKTSPPVFSNYCKQILNQHQQENISLGDKNPTNSLFGNQLVKIFPDAKFLWIIRDYRAQVNSMLNVNFEKKIISSLAARWVSYNKAIEKLRNKYPEKVLLIKYEDLVKHPEKNYLTICNFLEVPYTSQVLDTKHHLKEFFPKHHKNLDEKINTKHIDEWKTKLTKQQIRVCETVAGNYGESFGYKKTLSHRLSFDIKIFLGIAYGKLYITFIRMMYNLPLGVRFFINNKLIYKNATFWKELKNHYKV